MTLPSGYRRGESRCRLHRRCSPTNALMTSRPNTVSRSRRTRMTLCRPRYLLPRRLVGGRDQYGSRRRTLSSGFPSSGRFFRRQNLEGSRHRPCRRGESRKSTRGGTVKYGWATISKGSGTPGSFAALDAMDSRRAGLRGGKVIGYRRTATNRFIKRHSITLDQPRRGTTYTKSDENMLGEPPIRVLHTGCGVAPKPAALLIDLCRHTRTTCFISFACISVGLGSTNELDFYYSSSLFTA